MFNNLDKLLQNYNLYLCSLEAQMNLNDMDSGFGSIETLIAHVYDKPLPYKYFGRYSEVKDNITFIDTSIKGGELTKELKLQKISDYMGKEFSCLDTLKNIKHYFFFRGEAYVFTDYGIILFYGERGEDKNVAKISTIHMMVSNEADKDELEAFVNHNIVEIPQEQTQRNLSVCTSGSYGLNKSKLEVKPFDCNIKDNYNDDLPYEQLEELLNSEEEELILLHGEPGTGKTSIIKKLIHDNPQKEFIYFDFNLLTSFSDTKIFDFLSEHKQNVFIIEDCEKLFIDRNNGNQFLNSMLNLTDGIIGEAFAIKFICTFNCPKSKIDQAVLREGRLSLIYEFKKLSLEKTQKLLPNATQPMTLAQIYNQEDNGNKQKDKKIGF